MGDTQRIADLPHILFTAILHDAGAADHFQVGDFCQLGQNVILDAVGKERVLFLIARFSNGSTAMPVVTGCRINSVFQMIQPAAAARATRDAAKSALVGLRRTHFCPRVNDSSAPGQNRLVL